METPGPVCWVLNRLRGQLGLERHKEGAGLTEVEGEDNQREPQETVAG